MKYNNITYIDRASRLYSDRRSFYNFLFKILEDGRRVKRVGVSFSFLELLSRMVGVSVKLFMCADLQLLAHQCFVCSAVRLKRPFRARSEAASFKPPLTRDTGPTRRRSSQAMISVKQMSVRCAAREVCI